MNQTLTPQARFANLMAEIGFNGDLPDQALIERRLGNLCAQRRLRSTHAAFLAGKSTLTTLTSDQQNALNILTRAFENAMAACTEERPQRHEVTPLRVLSGTSAFGR